MRRIVLFAAIAALVPSAASAQTSRRAAAGSVDAEFAQADKNHDGFLSRPELEARLAKMKVGGRQLDAVHAKRVAGLFMARGDANKDGKISAAESRALFGTVFTAYDLNHDGKIDPREAAAAREAARELRTGNAPATPR